LARILRGDGHHVLAVETGALALAACDGQPFDLILSDIGLPEMNGWELLRRVREHYPLKAIALTAMSAPADFARSHAVGFHAHLVKPIDFAALGAAIARLFEPAAAAAEHA
jgi:CheY-like chemotaxis protein